MIYRFILKLSGMTLHENLILIDAARAKSEHR
jgi:hypothetical protein